MLGRRGGKVVVGKCMHSMLHTFDSYFYVFALHYLALIHVVHTKILHKVPLTPSWSLGGIIQAK